MRDREIKGERMFLFITKYVVFNKSRQLSNIIMIYVIDYTGVKKRSHMPFTDLFHGYIDMSLSAISD